MFYTILGILSSEQPCDGLFYYYLHIEAEEREAWRQMN